MPHEAKQRSVVCWPSLRAQHTRCMEWHTRRANQILDVRDMPSIEPSRLSSAPGPGRMCRSSVWSCPLGQAILQCIANLQARHCACTAAARHIAPLASSVAIVSFHRSFRRCTLRSGRRRFLGPNRRHLRAREEPRLRHQPPARLGSTQYLGNAFAMHVLGIAHFMDWIPDARLATRLRCQWLSQLLMAGRRAKRSLSRLLRAGCAT